MTKISIFGVGFVGSVMGTCLSERGHHVVGIDPDENKHTSRGGFLVSNDVKHAIATTDVSFICVGTPCLKDGSIDLSFIKNVCKDIGKELKNKEQHTVVVRSTIIPGTTQEVIIPILEEESGKKNHRDFDVYYYPEFLREKTAVNDFMNPVVTVIGSDTFYYSCHLIEIYQEFPGIKKIMPIRSAEMVKFASNTFHALKVVFANELALISESVGADRDLVAETLCLDTKLNISSAYLKPGPPFGGSCLPKDLSMLVFKIQELGLDIPLIQSILPSNNKHANREIMVGTTC